MLFAYQVQTDAKDSALSRENIKLLIFYVLTFYLPLHKSSKMYKTAKEKDITGHLLPWFLLKLALRYVITICQILLKFLNTVGYSIKMRILLFLSCITVLRISHFITHYHFQKS